MKIADLNPTTRDYQDGAGAGSHMQSLAILTAPRQHRISDPATVIKV